MKATKIGYRPAINPEPVEAPSEVPLTPVQYPSTAAPPAAPSGPATPAAPASMADVMMMQMMEDREERKRERAAQKAAQTRSVQATQVMNGAQAAKAVTAYANEVAQFTTAIRNIQGIAQPAANPIISFAATPLASSLANVGGQIGGQLVAMLKEERQMKRSALVVQQTYAQYDAALDKWNKAMDKAAQNPAAAQALAAAGVTAPPAPPTPGQIMPGGLQGPSGVAGQALALAQGFGQNQPMQPFQPMMQQPLQDPFQVQQPMAGPPPMGFGISRPRVQMQPDFGTPGVGIQPQTAFSQPQTGFGQQPMQDPYQRIRELEQKLSEKQDRDALGLEPAPKPPSTNPVPPPVAPQPPLSPMAEDGVAQMPKVVYQDEPVEEGIDPSLINMQDSDVAMVAENPAKRKKPVQ